MNAPCCIACDMKTLKVYDDVHTSVKVEAARSGRTTTNLASLLLKKAFELVASGKIKIPAADSETASTGK